MADIFKAAVDQQLSVALNARTDECLMLRLENKNLIEKNKILNLSLQTIRNLTVIENSANNHSDDVDDTTSQTEQVAEQENVLSVDTVLKILGFIAQRELKRRTQFYKNQDFSNLLDITLLARRYPDVVSAYRTSPDADTATHIYDLMQNELYFNFKQIISKLTVLRDTCQESKVSTSCSRYEYEILPSTWFVDMMLVYEYLKHQDKMKNFPQHIDMNGKWFVREKIAVSSEHSRTIYKYAPDITCHLSMMCSLLTRIPFIPFDRELFSEEEFTDIELFVHYVMMLSGEYENFCKNMDQYIPHGCDITTAVTTTTTTNTVHKFTEMCELIKEHALKFVQAMPRANTYRYKKSHIEYVSSIKESPLLDKNLPQDISLRYETAPVPETIKDNILKHALAHIDDYIDMVVGSFCNSSSDRTLMSMFGEPNDVTIYSASPISKMLNFSRGGLFASDSGKMITPGSQHSISKLPIMHTIMTMLHSAALAFLAVDKPNHIDRIMRKAFRRSKEHSSVVVHTSSLEVLPGLLVYTILLPTDDEVKSYTTSKKDDARFVNKSKNVDVDRIKNYFTSGTYRQYLYDLFRVFTMQNLKPISKTPCLQVLYKSSSHTATTDFDQRANRFLSSKELLALRKSEFCTIRILFMSYLIVLHRVIKTRSGNQTDDRISVFRGLFKNIESFQIPIAEFYRNDKEIQRDEICYLLPSQRHTISAEAAEPDAAHLYEFFSNPITMTFQKVLIKEYKPNKSTYSSSFASANNIDQSLLNTVERLRDNIRSEITSTSVVTAQ